MERRQRFLDQISSGLEDVPCVVRMVRCGFQELEEHLPEDAGRGKTYD